MLKPMLIYMWANVQNETIFFSLKHKILYLIMPIVEKISIKVTSWIVRLKEKKMFFWWETLMVINVLKFNRN